MSEGFPWFPFLPRPGRDRDEGKRDRLRAEFCANAPSSAFADAYCGRPPPPPVDAQPEPIDVPNAPPPGFPPAPPDVIDVPNAPPPGEIGNEYRREQLPGVFPPEGDLLAADADTAAVGRPPLDSDRGGARLWWRPGRASATQFEHLRWGQRVRSGA